MRTRHAASALIAFLGVAGLSACSSPSKSSPAETCKKVVSTLAPVTDKGVSRATGPALEVDAANVAFTPTCVTDVPRGTFALTVQQHGSRDPRRILVAETWIFGDEYVMTIDDQSLTEVLRRHLSHLGRDDLAAQVSE